MTPAINYGATYRPSGPLLRALRLDRWVCSTCQRDNLLRRGSSVLWRPCRWCGADMLSTADSVMDGLRRAFGQMGEALGQMGEALGRAVAAFQGLADGLADAEKAR